MLESTHALYCCGEDHQPIERGMDGREMDIQPGDFVLKMGIGAPGEIKALLSLVGSNGYVVVADPDRTNLLQARLEACPNVNVDFLCDDACALKPRDGLYHAIWCDASLLAGRGDPWGVIIALSRLLMPKGKLGVTLSQSGASEEATHGASKEQLPSVATLSAMMFNAGLNVFAQSDGDAYFIAAREDLEA